MRKRLIPCLVGLLLWMAWAPAPRALEPSSGDEGSDALLVEIAGLNRSLDQLVVLLRAGLAHQKIDVLLKRIELKERRMAPLERRLGNVQDEILAIHSDLARFETMKERAEEELLDREREGNEGAMNESRYMIHELEQAIVSERAKLEELERRVPLLENELADGRDEIAILDEMLAELLE